MTCSSRLGRAPIFLFASLLNACGGNVPKPIDGAAGPDYGDATTPADASSTPDADAEADANIGDADTDDADVTTAACDLVTQTGCALDQKCGLLTGNVPGCQAIGAKREYQDCDPGAVVDECAAGLACLRSPDSPAIPYQCTRFCTGVGYHGSCNEWDSCVSHQGIPARVCRSYTICRPVEQDCPIGVGGVDGCYIVEDHGAACLVPMLPATAVGGACSVASQCEIGSSCVAVLGRPQSERLCMKHCDPSVAVSGCPQPSICTPLGPSGVCR
jgi:hypothetical protein